MGYQIEVCHGDGLLRISRSIGIELEDGVLSRLDEVDLSSGEEIFTVVGGVGVFKEIGVIEDVSTGASGEIDDGEAISATAAADGQIVGNAAIRIEGRVEVLGRHGVHRDFFTLSL